jgi:hypothetical protein
MAELETDNVVVRKRAALLRASLLQLRAAAASAQTSAPLPPLPASQSAAGDAADAAAAVALDRPVDSASADVDAAHNTSHDDYGESWCDEEDDGGDDDDVDDDGYDDEQYEEDAADGEGGGEDGDGDGDGVDLRYGDSGPPQSAGDGNLEISVGSEESSPASREGHARMTRDPSAMF